MVVFYSRTGLAEGIGGSTGTSFWNWRSGTGWGGGVWLDATLQSTATSIHHPIEEEDTCFFLFGFVLFLFFSFLFFFFLVAVFRHRDAADVGGFRRSFVSRESDRWRCESNGLMPSSHTHTHTHTQTHRRAR